MSIHCISGIDICDTVYVNPQNQEQNDSLHKRVLAKSLLHILEKLIRHPHCNPSITNHDGMTPLQLAFKKEQLSAVEILLRVAKCSPEDITKAVQGSPYLLHHTIYGDKLRPFLMLIELKEYNINEVDSDHYSLLHVACTKENLEYLQVLTQQPMCDLNIQDGNGDTALYIAARSKWNSAKKIQCILKCDRCDPNITNKQEHTPLHTATVHNQLSCVQIFLNSTKYNPNIRDLQGNTALHLCMGQKSAPGIECFMMCDKVDANIQNGNGETPLHVAVVKETQLYALEKLIRHPHCNPSILNHENQTSLHIACRKECLKYIQALTKQPTCDLNIQDGNGDTALHIAACGEWNSAEKIQYITECDRCDPNITNKQGYTPLHSAIMNW